MTANLVKAEIREKHYSMDIYPNSTQIKPLYWTPKSLKVFMQQFTSSSIKQESIGQSIVKAACPRNVIPPLLFGLGTELDHMFGSRRLIDELFNLGFLASYSEVQRFKQAVACSLETQHVVSENLEDNSFIDFIADNVDHNLNTLGSKRTFHGMGVIAAITANGDIPDNVIISRPKKLIPVKVIANKGIPIQYYDETKNLLDYVKLKPRRELLLPYTRIQSVVLDQLWAASTLNRKAMQSGFMQNISQGVHEGQKKIAILPIMDFNPSDYLCIYSTLLFVQDQARQLDIKTTCLTFDQLLWQKAQEIVVIKSLDFIILSGGFHTLMSFTGTISHFMKGSGLSEALGIIYGESTVNKMLSGKSIACALRGLFLTERIEIQELLLSGNVVDQKDIDFIQNEINKLRNGDITTEYTDPNKIIKMLQLLKTK